MKITLIITAGGIGKRMGSSIPKQFLPISGEPVLLLTLKNLASFYQNAEIIITLPKDYTSEWELICSKHECTIPHRLVDGGLERFHSVKNAVELATGEVIVVHDGVRPFVSHETLSKLMDAIQDNPAVIPTTPVVESLRQLHNGKSVAVNRSDYRLVQTPQVFKTNILKKAYEQTFHSGITDDASLVEALGETIHLVDGNSENIKITTPEDLEFAALLLKRK